MVHLPLPSSWAPVSHLSYKPWLDDQDDQRVFFSSINLVAEDRERFYPCSGEDSDGPNVVNVGLTPLGPGPWDQKARIKLTQAQRADLVAAASREFRDKITQVSSSDTVFVSLLTSLVTERPQSLLPRLRAFAPDIVFISAGFDGHVDDFYQ